MPFHNLKIQIKTMTTKKYPPPVSLRLTPEERERLERDANGERLSAYIRSRIFSGPNGKPAPRRREPTHDQKMLAQILAKLGQSHIASNLNQLAKAANSGSLPVTPETRDELNAAYEEVGAIRSLLMAALGVKER